MNDTGKMNDTIKMNDTGKINDTGRMNDFRNRMAWYKAQLYVLQVYGFYINSLESKLEFPLANMKYLDALTQSMIVTRVVKEQRPNETQAPFYRAINMRIFKLGCLIYKEVRL